MNLDEELKQIRTIFDLELNECEELGGEKLEHFKMLVSLTEVKKIYFNKSNMVFTQVSDYNRVRDFFTDFEKVLRVECPKFQGFYYIGSYLNCPEIKQILWS